MLRLACHVCAVIGVLLSASADAQTLPGAEPPIDMQGFLAQSHAAAGHRATRRVSEQAFLKMAAEPGTVILDARSKAKYDLLHIEGAINLSFPDITIESLSRVIPEKTTRVLIYCNNNFKDAEAAFPSKLPSASLNLSTYVSLFTYGYRNVYELNALLDVTSTRLPLVARREGR